jgi:ABC-type polysaccharide/polyol phosphate transport system ATPase subunit
MQRILEMKREGRTILFVSHAAEAVRMLCERAIWLHQGEVQIDGRTDEVLGRYGAMLRAEASSS